MSTWFDARLIRRNRSYIVCAIDRVVQCTAACERRFKAFDSGVCSWRAFFVCILRLHSSCAFCGVLWRSNQTSVRLARRRVQKKRYKVMNYVPYRALVKLFKIGVAIQSTLSGTLFRDSPAARHWLSTRQINQAFNFPFKAHLIFPGSCATVRLWYTPSHNVTWILFSE